MKAKNILFYAAALVLSLLLLAAVMLNVGKPGPRAQAPAISTEIMDKYEMRMTNRVSDALDGVLAIEKVYWLKDEDLVSPEPDQSKFGEAETAAELQWLLDDAADLLEGQDTYFSTEAQLHWGSNVKYYLDETIFAVAWKEYHGSVYTFAEIKIAHPSQFRRFLAGGEFGSVTQFYTTEMSESVNAVVASSGDFYKFRNYGTIVYDGTVQRINSVHIDTCFIDDQGDLHLIPKNTIIEMEEAQKYVDEHNIRFSVAFGPILVDNYERCEPNYYMIGEINDEYPRAALCQMGPLHYLLVTANDMSSTKQAADNDELKGIAGTPTIHQFARVIQATGCEKAYALDGGQTAAIAMNDQLVNRVLYGYQRKISDIIYFATAVPEID